MLFKTIDIDNYWVFGNFFSGVFEEKHYFWVKNPFWILWNHRKTSKNEQEMTKNARKMTRNAPEMSAF